MKAAKYHGGEYKGVKLYITEGFLLEKDYLIKTFHHRRFVNTESGDELIVRYTDNKRNDLKEVFQKRSIVSQEDIEKWKLSPYGGKTEVQRIDLAGESEPILTASSACSVLDRFNKRVGRNIALGRRFKQYASEFGTSNTRSQLLHKIIEYNYEKALDDYKEEN